MLRHAKEARADLIVLGTGERLHFGTSWLGRTTDRVMRQATCPVFVVPAQRRLIAQDAAPLGPERWAQVFDRVTLQHQGEPTTVSILGDVMGVEVEAAARPLVALTSESRFGEHSIAVILGMPDGTHLTHFVVKPTEVRIGEARDHHNVELLITALDGTTTVVDVGAAHPS